MVHFGNGFGEKIANITFRIFRTEIRIRHHIVLKRMIKRGIVDIQSRSERPSRVSRGWLDVDILEQSFLENESVSDTIERDASGETEIVRRMYPFRVLRYFENNFFGNHLERRGDIFFPLCEQNIRVPRGCAKETVKCFIRHHESVFIREIAHRELETSVILDVDKLPHFLLKSLRVSVWSEPHHFILRTIHLKTEVICKSRV